MLINYTEKFDKYFLIKFQYDCEMRLDKFLKRSFVNFTNSMLQKYIRGGDVKIKNENSSEIFNADSAFQMNKNYSVLLTKFLFNKFEKITKEENAKKKNEVLQNCEFEGFIIKETNDYIALNKPSGICVQGGENVTLHIDLWLKKKSLEENLEYKLVHRLDRDTSGVILIAKSLESAIYLTKLFKDRKIKKEYLAITHGKFEKKSGEINAAIMEKFSKDKFHRGEFMCINKMGKPAVTKFIVNNHNEEKNISEVLLIPETGRKHQLRLHMLEAGHGILGDKKYKFSETKNHSDESKSSIETNRKLKNKKLLDVKNLMLHASKIKFKNLDGNEEEVFAEKPNYWLF